MIYFIIGSVVFILVGGFCYKIMKDEIPLIKKIGWISLSRAMAGLILCMLTTNYQDKQIRLENERAEFETHSEIFWERCHGVNMAVKIEGQLLVFYTQGLYEPRYFLYQRDDTLYFKKGYIPILTCQ